MQPEQAGNGGEPVRDPVTGFRYPPAWLSRCDPAALPGIASGLLVLTADGTVLRRGYTTGTTAAAACKAAILSLAGDVSSVTVTLPCGIVLDVPASGKDGVASSTKFAGDYPGDVTAGIRFRAVATRVPEPGLHLMAGEGIGRFSRSTPRFRKGDPAISPHALQCIHDAMAEAAAPTGPCGISVELSVPSGKIVARKTLNPRVGVAGGISVLGSTGLVEPWDDHLGESAIARVAEAERVVITTGRTGLRYSRLLFPDREVVLVGSRIGQALGHASGDVTICGLPGLILRYIEPSILEGTEYGTVEELAESGEFAERAGRALEKFGMRTPGVRVVLVDRNGRVLWDTGSSGGGT